MQARAKEPTALILADEASLGRAEEQCRGLKREGFHVIALLSIPVAEGAWPADEILTGEPQKLLAGFIQACERSTHTTYPERVYLFLREPMAAQARAMLVDYPVELIA